MKKLFTNRTVSDIISVSDRLPGCGKMSVLRLLYSKETQNTGREGRRVILEVNIADREAERLAILKSALGLTDLSDSAVAARLLENAINAHFPVTQAELDAAIMTMPALVGDTGNGAEDHGSEIPF